MDKLIKMKDNIKNYLTAKNILWILLAWIGVTFIVPGGNSWIKVPDEFLEHWYYYFIAEFLFIAFCFSFKQLLDKEYKKVLFLSSGALLNLGLCYFLVFSKNIDTSIIPFFHPITMSLSVIFIIERKFMIAVAGYILGYFLSFAPLIGSIIPILFLQLWFYSLDSDQPSKKISRFLSRLMINAIIGALIYYMTFGILKDNLLYPSVSFSKLQEMILSILTVIVIYIILNRYLKIYYSNYSNRIMKRLSYIPILWIIPLIEILVKENKQKTIE
jgi:hypothetical protein